MDYRSVADTGVTFFTNNGWNENQVALAGINPQKLRSNLSLGRSGAAAHVSDDEFRSVVTIL